MVLQGKEARHPQATVPLQVLVVPLLVVPLLAVSHHRECLCQVPVVPVPLYKEDQACLQDLPNKAASHLVLVPLLDRSHSLPPIKVKPEDFR
jgi:hypothetical protein